MAAASQDPSTVWQRDFAGYQCANSNAIVPRLNVTTGLGRRLISAAAHVEKHLRYGLTSANHWTPTTSDLGVGFGSEAQAATRGTCHWNGQTFHFLQEISWLLEPLCVPGVARACIQQYDTLPELEREQNNTESSWSFWSAAQTD